MSVDLRDLSRSYPFLHLSRKFGVDYGVVLAIADGYRKGYLKPPADPLPIYSAIETEVRRAQGAVL